jgi:hypothetical protein
MRATPPKINTQFTPDKTPNREKASRLQEVEDFQIISTRR